MKTTVRIAALVLATAAATLGCTAQADQTTDKLKTTLQARLGDATVKSIEKSPIPGLYEVNLGSQIVYSDAAGDYVLLGDLVDTKTRKNLTEARMAEINKVDFASLPLNNAIKYVKGNGARKIAVFSDPNCPYCKRFESTLQSMDNITVYTFLYPVLTPDSTVKSKAIWCASDRAKSWENWMVSHQPPSGAGNCDTSALDKNLALGRGLNVTGTPTIILADGTRLPGAVSADQLNSALASVK
ncbi:DsbC family protein [Burkholderia gladioli]|uniref:DsbC family protein n=1 Tax=Burkholderia gladioli TaxID=28095 RepID=UPI00163EBCB1|nr:DsbC family protein [Burkholderia gladioli]MDC6131348.1 DsbC family protein [Burkholderia gladioli]